MINTLSWNVRGIGSQGSVERLNLLLQQFQLPMISLQEPMVDSGKMRNLEEN